MKGERVAVLGAGIMGCVTALLLAREGFRVTLVEGRSTPLGGASRWNEGKIHLGYLYAADPSFDTARHVQLGGLSFAPIIESLIGTSLDGHTTARDDLYLVHRDSVSPAPAVAAYFEALTAALRASAAPHRYLTDLTEARVRRLTQQELAELTDPALVSAAFAVPERSVQTNWLADQLCAALAAEPLIELNLNCRVTAARPLHADDGPWQISVDGGVDGPYDWVVNALWEGRVAVDLASGTPPPPGWTHRYRVSLFGRTAEPVDLPSAVVGFGPFGDVKNYDGQAFYMSWYPAGLLVETGAVEPAPPPRPDPDRLIAATRQGLAGLLPWVDAWLDQAETVQVEGGWVFAQGRGSLADPAASLHRRDRFGVLARGRYLSVDTGKFSSAPLLARQVVARIVAGPGTGLRGRAS